VFGPHKRGYRHDVSVALRRQALRCLLSDRAQQGAIAVMDGLQFDAPKTKEFASMTAQVAADSKRTLVITASADRNTYLSARNIPRVTVCPADDVNALDVIDATRVVIAQDALPKLESRLTKRARVQETAQ